jgi:hypothetical protein
MCEYWIKISTKAKLKRKGKDKFALYLTKHHAMKTRLFLNQAPLHEDIVGSEEL